MNNLLMTLLISFSFSFSSFGFENIVGGTEVNSEESQTSHIVNISGQCAGSVIASKWILTAAHCAPVFGKFVTAGSIDLKSKERFKLEVKKGHVHPDYNDKTYTHDIALIELKYPIHFENMGITPIELLTPELEKEGYILPGVEGTLMGWGAIREGGKYSNILLKVEVPIITHEIANKTEGYSGKVDQTMIPAGFAEGGKDSCQGDSGGPFTVVGPQGKTLLAGIISWGWGCAKPRQYGISSNVAKSYDWIVKTIK